MKKIKYISAGAGSGKTTRIVNELVNVLKDAKMNVKPSEVMMTTFSRAAAYEMRERARQGLLAQNEVNKASELDAASIGTIHSICLNFLQKYWYLVGISPEPKQLEDVDFNKFADISINTLVSDEDISVFEQWRKKLNITKGMRHEDDFLYWRRFLKKMMSISRYYGIENLEDSCFKSITEIENFFASRKFDKTTYDELVKAYLDANDKDRSKKGDLKVNAITRKEKIENYDPERDGIEKFPTTTAKCVMEESKAIEDYLIKTLPFTDDAREALINIVKKLFDVLEEWSDKYKAFKEEHCLLDYNDMELYFKELLDNEEVQEDVKKRYKLIMVDEYQDCNSIQVEIFKKLSDLVAVNSPLSYSSVWVGDPKQAIYGFRGSDTKLTKSVSDEIFDKVERKVAGFDVEELKFNYRSRPDLVNLANEIFVPIFNCDMREEEIVLNPKRKERLKGQVSVMKWKLEKDDTEKQLARYIKAMVESKKYKVQLKQDKDNVRELRYEDVAVLVRKNYSIEKIADALRDIGVPVCAPELNSFSNVEIQLLLALLQYAKEPKYRSHLRLDIIHLLKNVSTKEVLDSYVEYVHDKIEKEVKDGHEVYKFPGWYDDDDLIRQVECVSKECYAKNMHDTLAAFVDRLHLMDLVNRWGNADIRRENMVNILKRSKQFDTHCEQLDLEADKNKFSKFVQYLIDTPMNVNLDLERKAVKVITYHKSKGLEWPVVILYDLDNKTLSAEKIVEHEFVGVKEQKSSDDSYWLRVFPPMGSAIAKVYKSLTDEPYFISSKDRARKEESRLLYVGVTRARDLLVFATKEDRMGWLDEMGDERKLSKKIQDLNENVDFEIDDKLEKIGDEEYDEIDVKVLTLKEQPQAHLLTPSKMSEDLTETKYNVNVVTVDDAAFVVDLEKSDVRMSRVGTCVHNIYAAFDPKRKKEETLLMAQGIIGAFGLEKVIDAEKVINSITLLYARLTERFGEPTAVEHELPFALAMPNDQLLRGEIDLLWETSNGTVIVDFKNVGDETPDPAHYYAQMSAYRKAVEQSKRTCRAIVLYYANLGKMVILDNSSATH